MSNNWPKVRLSEVLTPVSRPVVVDPTAIYHLLGAHWYAKGLYTKDVVPGSEIQAKRVYRVEQADFVYNRLFGWKGSFAVATEENHGCYVSNEFPCFIVKSDRADGKYIWRYFSLPSVWDAVLDLSSGGTPTSRNRLKEEQLLAMEIPLPSVTRQQRIVARIEELAARINEARALRRQAAEETEQVMAAEERRIWNDDALRDSKPLDSLALFLARGKQSEQGHSEHFLIKTQHVQQDRYIPTLMRLATHIAAKVRPEALVRDGDILIACSAAGCLGRVARYRGDGLVASTDTHVAIARPNPDAVDPDYLYAYLRGSQGQQQLRSRERGDWQREKIGFRLTELNLNDLREVPVPISSFPEQRRIVDYLTALQEKVNTLRALQNETSKQLDALVPSILDKAFRGGL